MMMITVRCDDDDEEDNCCDKFTLQDCRPDGPLADGHSLQMLQDWNDITPERVTSIHPFSTTYLGSGCINCSFSRRTQTSLSLATSASSDWESPQCSPASAEISSPPGPGSASGPPPSWTCLKHLPREATRRHPYQMPRPPQLAPFIVKESKSIMDD